MNIATWYQELGIPKTGLSATIDIWELDGTQVVTADAMTEIAGGFYVYDFTSFDSAKEYVVRTNAGEDLDGADRYNFTTAALVSSGATVEEIDAELTAKHGNGLWVRGGGAGGYSITAKEVWDYKKDDKKAIDILSETAKEDTLVESANFITKETNKTTEKKGEEIKKEIIKTENNVIDEIQNQEIKTEKVEVKTEVVNVDFTEVKDEIRKTGEDMKKDSEEVKKKVEETNILMKETTDMIEDVYMIVEDIEEGVE